MSRKKFSFGVAAGAALLAAAPVMAHPGGDHTHLWNVDPVEMAQAVEATPLPADPNKVTGQGELQFKVLHTSAALPAKALDGLNAAHGGFAVDRREGKGEVYFALPQVGIIRIANDLNTIEILPTDAEMATKNMHNSKIWTADGGKAYLTFPGTDSARVWTTTTDGALVNTLDAPTAETPFADEVVSSYFKGGGKFVPTDVEFLNDRFYVTTGYSDLDYVLTADVESGKKFSSAWTPLAFGGRDAANGPGKLGTGHGITLAPDGTITVADRANSELESYKADGTHLGKLNLPPNSRPCDVDYQSGYTVVGCLEGPDKATAAAPIYILKDGEILSTILIKDELGLEKFTHIHNAVMVEKDGKFYVIAQAWNPGDFAILEQVK